MRKRSSSATKVQEGAEPGELIEDDHDTKLLKRKVEATAPTPASTQASRPREKARNNVRRGLDGWDNGEDRLEKLVSEPKTSGEVNGISTKSSGDARPIQANGVAAAEAPQPTPANERAKEASHSERASYDSKQRARSRSPPSSNTSDSKLSTSTTQPSSSAPSKQVPVSTHTPLAAKATGKESISKRSFGHVLLPHELPADLRGKNYMAMASYKPKVQTVFKTAAEMQSSDTKMEDPRKDGLFVLAKCSIHSSLFGTPTLSATSHGQLPAIWS